MLKPADLTSDLYDIALKPALGQEMQLLVSTQASLELGSMVGVAQNSGVYTANNAANAALQAAPAELLAMLESDINVDTLPVLTITGTDQSGGALTGTATFAIPAYAQDTSKVLPGTWATEVTVTVGKLFKTITNVTIACDTKLAGKKITLFALPSLSSFNQIGCKTDLNWVPRNREPVNIQCGADESAFVKPGMIPKGEIGVTAKIPNFSDGLARYNGVRVTGLIKEVKEDKVATAHIFFLGLILTSQPKAGESTDPATFTAKGIYEDAPWILAK